MTEKELNRLYRQFDQECAGIASPDTERYRRVLEEERGVSLDELFMWYEEEVVKTREEMYDIGSRIDLGGESIPRTVPGVAEALNKYAGPAANAAEMFARCRDYLARAREGTRGYVNMPEEVCRVVPVCSG